MNMEPPITSLPKKRRSPAVLPLIIITATVTLVIGIGLGLIQANVQPPDTGPAPDFSLTTFTGQPFHLAEQKGKLTVINFWASWCTTCPPEVPLLNRIWDDYKDKGLTIIAVAHLDNQSDSLAFIKQYAGHYPAASDDANHVSDLFHIRQVPETYLIDQTGQIAYAIHGEVTSSNAAILRTKIDQLLAAPKAS